jgi:hypothetical protein
MFKTRYRLYIAVLIPLTGILFSFSFGEKNCADPGAVLQTQNVIILVIDGPRYSETFGDPELKYIPHLSADLAPQGVLIKKFRNNGPTYTNAGHSAITTGVYQRINNNGEELPKNPGMFQYFLKEKNLDSTHAWVIASKGKLSILGNTKNRNWKNQFQPSLYCGIDGKGEGYTPDVYNWRDAQRILKQYHPKLALINMLEVDVRGHQNEWPEYLQALKNTDQIAFDLWNFIQSDSIYRDKTTLFITNDHGRHLDGHKDGFISHGDNCEGCRQIYMIALGPDFKKNTVLTEMYEQIDISKTISYMLDFSMPTSDGVIMEELFENHTFN